MDKYEALKMIWEDGEVIHAHDDMGIKYEFKRENNKLVYTRLGCDVWFNELSVTNFLNEFKGFKVAVLEVV